MVDESANVSETAPKMVFLVHFYQAIDILLFQLAAVYFPNREQHFELIVSIYEFVYNKKS